MVCVCMRVPKSRQQRATDTKRQDKTHRLGRMPVPLPLPLPFPVPLPVHVMSDDVGRHNIKIYEAFNKFSFAGSWRDNGTAGQRDSAAVGQWDRRQSNARRVRSPCGRVS